MLALVNVAQNPAINSALSKTAQGINGIPVAQCSVPIIIDNHGQLNRSNVA